MGAGQLCDLYLFLTLKEKRVVVIFNTGLNVFDILKNYLFLGDYNIRGGIYVGLRYLRV